MHKIKLNYARTYRTSVEDWRAFFNKTEKKLFTPKSPIHIIIKESYNFTILPDVTEPIAIRLIASPNVRKNI